MNHHSQRKTTARSSDDGKKFRLLIIDSVRDATTLKRRKKICRARELRTGFDIDYMYLIEPEDFLHAHHDPEALLQRSAAFGEWLPQIDIRARLFLRILARMYPKKGDYLLIYTGFTFHQFQCQLYWALLKLKHHLPEIKVATFSAGKPFDIPVNGGLLEPLGEYEQRAVYDIPSHSNRKMLFNPPIGLLDGTPFVKTICNSIVTVIQGSQP